MTAHKHAALMLQYAQDAAETDKPWERWEYNTPNEGEVWHPFTMSHPSWMPECEYRRKPRTMTYTVTIPEPLREAPPFDTDYYVANPTDPSYVFIYRWVGSGMGCRLLARGLCFATKEDAITAAKALLPVKGGVQ